MWTVRGGLWHNFGMTFTYLRNHRLQRHGAPKAWGTPVSHAWPVIFRNISGGRWDGRYSGVYERGGGLSRESCIARFCCVFPWETPEKVICLKAHVILGLWCGPFPPARESGQPKSPRIPRRPRQNASSPQELSIGASHVRDTPGRSRDTFGARANFSAFFTSRGCPRLLRTPGPGRRES